MTTKNYYTSSNYAATIPTREEFHQFASNIISIADFDTDHSNGLQTGKVDSAIKWTIKHNKKNSNSK